MCGKEVVQHLCVFTVAFGVKVEFPDVAGRVVLLHVFPETYFASFLLVGAYDAFVYLAEDGNFLCVFSGQKHQHAGGKVSALV